jgi:hypothetical protein
MIRAATTLIAFLLSAEIGSEKVEVRDRGAVDLATFECRDTPRSTVIQRACYDRAQATLIVNVKGAYRQYCGLPAVAFDQLLTAPSMGKFYKANIEGAGSAAPYVCADRQVPKRL